MDTSVILKKFIFSGKKESNTFSVLGMQQGMPYTVLYGVKPGPAVLITAGIHSCEYVGIQALIELSQELSTEELCGNLVLVPVVNRFGFENNVPDMVYEDRKNLNRVFPGCQDGSAANRLAAAVYTGFIQHSDYYIDLHCGDCYEDMVPYVYYVGDTGVEKKSRELAHCIDVSYSVRDSSKQGQAYYVAAAHGIPSILIERGNYNSWSNKEVEETKKNLINLLRYVHMLEGQATRYEQEQEFTDICYIYAPKAGCWYPKRKSGDRIRKNELVGEIRGYAGELKAAVFSERSGVILYQAATLNIAEGGLAVACGVGDCTVDR